MSDPVERQPATGKSYPIGVVEPTEYFCTKCQAMKFRCEGCRKIICLCNKRNGHLIFDDTYLCMIR